MAEILYHCPHCDRSGFTHRGLSAHFCEGAPALASAPLWRGKRMLTKSEVAKIVVSTPVPPTQ
jgi:hypothetical protein